FVCCLPCLFLPASRICAQGLDLPFHTAKAVRVESITIGFQLRNGQTALGRTRMAGDKDKVAIRSPPSVPLQVILALHRLAVFVNAKHSEIDVKARIGEIVRIASKKSGLLFRSENKSNVGIFLIPVKPVLAAFIEGYDIRPQSRFIEALLLDSGLLGLTGIE